MRTREEILNKKRLFEEVLSSIENTFNFIETVFEENVPDEIKEGLKEHKARVEVLTC